MMKPKTRMPILELNVGDRFYFETDKNRNVCQITEATGNFRAYNQKLLDRWVWKFDKVDHGKRIVIFLRSILD